MRVEMDFYGERVVRELVRVNDQVQNAEPTLREVGLFIMEDVVAKQFEKEGRGPSGPWQELAASTVKYKAKKGLDPRILRATGFMSDQLTTPGDNPIVTDDSVYVVSTAGYLKFHQSRKPRTKLPRRPVFDLTEGDKRNVLRVIQAGLFG